MRINRLNLVLITVLFAALLLFGMSARADAVCMAAFDCDGNGVSLTVSDYVYFLHWLQGDGPAPVNICDADINGDCYVDQADAELFAEYLIHGWVVLPHWPVPTCDNPDTTRGACCDTLGACGVRSPANCQARFGTYHGDYVWCNQSLCSDCGDINLSGRYDISDAVYMVLYIFSGGPAPLDSHDGDVNCDDTCDVSDVVYLLQFIFSNGPVPCNGCK